jgi:hypothetical protein
MEDLLFELMQEAKAAAADADRERDVCERALADVLPGWPAWLRVLAGAVILALTALAIAGIGAFLWPNLDLFFLRPYLEEIFGDDVHHIAQLSLWIALACVAVVLLSLVIVLWGTIPAWAKACFLGGEVLYCTAFAVVRRSAGFTAQSVSNTLFEMAMLLPFSAALGLVATRFARELERSATYRRKQNALAAATKASDRAQERLAKIQSQLTAHLQGGSHG